MHFELWHCMYTKESRLSVLLSLLYLRIATWSNNTGTIAAIFRQLGENGFSIFVTSVWDGPLGLK